ncbi:MAG: TonB family protein [Acidobacteriota bacterium]
MQELFESALEQPSDEVASWLDRACGDDGTLRLEVEDLLRSDAEAGSFIETAIRGVANLSSPVAGPPNLPERFGKYEIDSKIGRGGFGVVYRGRDPLLQREVALKTCSTDNRHLRQRFFREGRLAAGLQHLNITAVHDLGVADGVPYLVQELLEGEDLDVLIKRREALPLVDKLEILTQIAHGLEYAHRAGVLHRDIKPANIRRLADGRVKIMDFGIAKLLTGGTQLTGTGMAMGTVGYLAPEQLRGEDIDTRADVFSFGVLAYELLSYQRPFRGENFSQVSYQLLYRQPAPMLEAWPECPRVLALLVDRCIEKQPALRFMTFSEVLEVLEPCLAAAREGADGVELDRIVELPAYLLPESLTLPSGSERFGTGRWMAGVPLLVLAILAAAMGVTRWGSHEPALPRQSEDSRREGSQQPVLETAVLETLAVPETTAVLETLAVPETPAVETMPLDAGQLSDSGPELRVPRKERKDSMPVEESPVIPLGPNIVDHAAVAVSSWQPSQNVPRVDALPAVTDSVEPSAVDEPRWIAEELPSPTEATPMSPTGLVDTPATVVAGRSEREASAEALSDMKLGDLIVAGKGVVAPRLVEKPQPSYPQLARRRGREARVSVRVLVNERGEVVHAVAPSDPMGFATAAKESASSARFEPPTRNGIAGKMWTEIVFEFKLDS